jgi:hypothetical protein
LNQGVKMKSPFSIFFGRSKKEIKIEEFKSAWGLFKKQVPNFHQIEKYHIKSKPIDFLQILQRETQKDIDFENVFQFADRTSSNIGQQFLYDKLLTIYPDQSFAYQEQMINTISKDEKSRYEAQYVLSKLNNSSAYGICNLFLNLNITAPKYLYLVRILSVISFIVFALIFISAKFLLLFIPIVIVNVWLHYSNKKNIDGYSSAMKQLGVMSIVSNDLLKLPIPYKNELAVKRSLVKLKPINNAWFFFESHFQNGSDLSELIWILLEYVKIMFLLEPILFYNTLIKVDDRKKDVEEIFNFIGELDCFISIASIRHSVSQYSIPQIDQKFGKLSFERIYHPLISNCVSNSLTIDNNSVLLTGTNMSGKTAFLRTIAINVLFAQTINTCFAEKFTLPPLKIFSVINISDSLADGRSYYFEEVLRIKFVIEECATASKSIFLLDELYKGTNTPERIAATYAVLSHLNKNNFVVASTHDTELSFMLENKFELYHFTEVVKDNEVFFDYKLKKGSLRYGNAIKILGLNGYPLIKIHKMENPSNLYLNTST